MDADHLGRLRLTAVHSIDDGKYYDIMRIITTISKSITVMLNNDTSRRISPQVIDDALKHSEVIHNLCVLCFKKNNLKIAMQIANQYQKITKEIYNKSQKRKTMIRVVKSHLLFVEIYLQQIVRSGTLNHLEQINEELAKAKPIIKELCNYTISPVQRELFFRFHWHQGLYAYLSNDFSTAIKELGRYFPPRDTQEFPFRDETNRNQAHMVMLQFLKQDLSFREFMDKQRKTKMVDSVLIDSIFLKHLAIILVSEELIIKIRGNWSDEDLRAHVKKEIESLQIIMVRSHELRLYLAANTNDLESSQDSLTYLLKHLDLLSKTNRELVKRTKKDLLKSSTIDNVRAIQEIIDNYECAIEPIDSYKIIRALS